jgi:hypothetical protein
MSIVSLVIAPTLAQVHPSNSSDIKVKTEKNVEISIINSDNSKAQVTMTEGPDQGLIHALEVDGLLSKTGANIIQFENDSLIVNGKSVDVSKYRTFIKGDKVKIVIGETQSK